MTVSGVKVARTDALLLVLSLAILPTLTVIGVTLVAATLVIPAVVARMLTNRFARVLRLSSGIGAACGFVGMNLSHHLDVPSGTTIVLTGALVFLVVLSITGGQRLQRTSRLDAGGTSRPARCSTSGVNALRVVIHRRPHPHGRGTLDGPSRRPPRVGDVRLLWGGPETLTGITSPV